MTTQTAKTRKNAFSAGKAVTLTINWDLSYAQAKKKLPWLSRIDEAEYNKARADRSGKQKIKGRLIPPPSRSKKKCLEAIENEGYEPFGLIETIALGMKRLWLNGSRVASLGFEYQTPTSPKTSFVPIRKRQNDIEGYMADYVLDIRNIRLAIKKKEKN